jgi:hypothetical protein
VSTEGWIFMVGFRVFDVGLLIIWLVWFFRRMRDDDGDDDSPGGGGGGGPEPRPGGGPGGGGLRLPLGRARQEGRRIRDHSRRPVRPRRRGAEPVPRPLPARVRRPAQPTPVHRRV